MMKTHHFTENSDYLFVDLINTINEVNYGLHRRNIKIIKTQR